MDNKYNTVRNCDGIYWQPKDVCKGLAQVLCLILITVTTMARRQRNHFDGAHFGHANSLRQAKSMGDILVAGVHSDEEIRRCKGPPVFHENERYAMIEAVKWVDEIVEGSPFCPTVETVLASNCDFASHGDDVSITTDGHDTYGALKEADLFRLFKRTPGTSTTDIIDRILHSGSTPAPVNRAQIMHLCHLFAQPCYTESQLTHDAVPVFEYVTESTLSSICNVDTLIQWQNANETIGYLSGTWDLFHPGHLSQMIAARNHCHRLVIGVTERNIDDSSCLQDMYERALTIIACKYVDAVLINAPICITSNTLDRLKISNVCVLKWQPSAEYMRAHDYHVIEPVCKLTTQSIIARVLSKKSQFRDRNDRKRNTLDKAIAV